MFHRSASGFFILLFVACGSDVPEDSVALTNSAGKDDSASFRFQLTESNGFVGMGIVCEAELGCDGFLQVEVRSPDACSLLGDERCGIRDMPATEAPIAKVILRSATEGERVLPLTVSTDDGSFFSSSVAVAFTGTPGEEIEIDIERTTTADAVTLSVKAEWQDSVDPGVRELVEFLESVDGLDYEELPTAYPGYRAFQLGLEQPLDHTGAVSGSFRQRAVLHHLERAAPMVLYTSGYSLFSEDYLAELAEGLGANQLSTEQRFFGESIPDGFTDEAWEHVTIAQAAADHHAFVEALRPFYDGSWIGTGHSKGGMTSIYHRRFYPEDLAATVAYVAPISFAPSDPRYQPFLDSIGEDTCREHIRLEQRLILERLDDVIPLVEAELAEHEVTYELAGGLRNALEDSVEGFEWNFWQGQGIQACGQLRDLSELRALDDASFWEWMRDTRTSYGAYDTLERDPDFDAYNYQAARELGYQSTATDHLEGVLMSPGLPWAVPEGTDPMHDPAPMADIQQWVLDEATRVIFLYGEYDPWTGGAFDTPDSEDVLHVTVPAAHHGAMVRDLPDADQARVLDAIESWIGQRPAITPSWQPSRAPMPAWLLRGRSPQP